MKVLVYKVLLPGFVSIFHLGKIFYCQPKFLLHIFKFPYVINTSVSQEVKLFIVFDSIKFFQAVMLLNF